MQLVVIHWKIGNASGHGKTLRLDDFVARWLVENLNETYGPGTHWIVEVEEPPEISEELPEELPVWRGHRV